MTTGYPPAPQAPPTADDQFTSNAPATTRWDGHSIIAFSFDHGRGVQALTLLKELDSQRRVGVEEAVVVRDEDGQPVEKDRIESTFLPATTGGGLIGLLLGIVGGPFGVLIGGRLDSWSARCWTWPTG